MAQPSISFNSQQFHQIYRSCFDDLNSFDRLMIKNDYLYRAVEKELPNLILANSEEEMLASAKKVRELFCQQDGPMIGMFKQFMSFSEKVTNSQKFWGSFAPSLPLDTAKPIQILVITRLKSIQEDFKKVFSEKSINWNEKSVKACLADAEFFVKKEKVKNALQEALEAKKNEINYLLPGQQIPDENIAALGRVNFLSDTSIDTFCRKCPQFGQRIKEIRAYWVDEALQGRLVMENVKILRISDSNYQIDRIPLEKNLTNYVFGYRRTMQWLVYHEMVKGNIRYMEEVLQFVGMQMMKNPLFLGSYVHLGEDSHNFPESCVRYIMEAFEKILPTKESPDTNTITEGIRKMNMF